MGKFDTVIEGLVMNEELRKFAEVAKGLNKGRLRSKVLNHVLGRNELGVRKWLTDTKKGFMAGKEDGDTPDMTDLRSLYLKLAFGTSSLTRILKNGL